MRSRRLRIFYACKKPSPFSKKQSWLVGYGSKVLQLYGMGQKNIKAKNIPFFEKEWMELLFQLASMQKWIHGMSKDLLAKLPLAGIARLQYQNYFLSITALAHILHRHYCNPATFPKAAQFHIPVPAIVGLIKNAASLPAVPVAGSNNRRRILISNDTIGRDRQGLSTKAITIITSPGGDIITAFPGE